MQGRRQDSLTKKNLVKITDNDNLVKSRAKFIQNSLEIIELKNWLLILSIPVIIYILMYYGLPLLNYICPSCFNYLISICNRYGYLLIGYSLFVWFIFLTIQTAIELYIYYLTDNNKELLLKTKTNNLPNFIRKWILEIIENFKKDKELDIHLLLIRSTLIYLLFCLTLVIIVYFVLIFDVSNDIIKDIKLVTPKESNVLNVFIDLYNSYQDFLMSLSLEQKIALANFWGNIIILSCFITILSIFYGDKLIIYYKLEEKYPRLARFIEIRRRVKRYSLIFEFLFIFFILICIISFNLYFIFFVYNA